MQKIKIVFLPIITVWFCSCSQKKPINLSSKGSSKLSDVHVIVHLKNGEVISGNTLTVENDSIQIDQRWAKKNEINMVEQKQFDLPNTIGRTGVIVMVLGVVYMLLFMTVAKGP
jgi:hypothetical protein